MASRLDTFDCMKVASVASVLAALVLLATGGCNPVVGPEPVPTYVVRLRMPLEGERARTCDLECRSRGPDSSLEFLECLSQCPDTEVRDGASCAESDQRPDVLCARVLVAEGGYRESALLKILGVVAASGAAVVTRAATDAAAESARARSRTADSVPGPLPGK